MATPVDYSLEGRRRYVEAFNSTMVKIWLEQISRLEAIDTGRLYRSVKMLKSETDDKIIDINLSWEFVAYGIYVDSGVGREVYKGNAGDIGRDKVREAKPWFNNKFYSSYMRIRDYFAQSLGKEFCDTVSFFLDHAD